MCSPLTSDPRLMLMTVASHWRFLMLLMSEPCDDFIFIFQLFPETCHLLHQLLHLLGSAVIFAGIQTLWSNLTIIHLQQTLEFKQL